MYDIKKGEESLIHSQIDIHIQSNLY